MRIESTRGYEFRFVREYDFLETFFTNLNYIKPEIILSLTTNLKNNFYLKNGFKLFDCNIEN